MLNGPTAQNQHRCRGPYTDDELFSSFPLDNVQIHLELVVTKNNMKILVDVLKVWAKLIFDFFVI